MLESKKQAEILLFIEKLYQQAKESSMKRRTLDRIKDVKDVLAEELDDNQLEEKVQEIDEIMRDVQMQLRAAGGMETAVNDSNVSSYIEDAFKKQHTENDTLRSSDIFAQQSCMEDAKRKMRELINVQSRFEEIINVGKFCSFFAQIGERFNQQTREGLRKYADTVYNNCSQTLKRINGMLHSMQDEKFHLRESDLYQVFASKSDGIKQEAMSRSDGAENGGNIIALFGEQHAKAVAHIVSKNKRKKVLVKLLPLLIILALATVPKLTDMISSNQKVSEQAKGQEGESNIQLLMKKLPSAVGSVMKFLGNFLLPLFICVVVLPYFLYMRFVNKCYRRWVCLDAELYMSREVEAFWKNNPLNEPLEHNFENIQMLLENNFQQVIEDMLSKTPLNQLNENLNKEENFRLLMNKWDNIR